MVRRTGRRHHFGKRDDPLDGVPWPRGFRAGPPLRRPHREKAASRGWLVDVPRRQDGDQRKRQSLFRPETCRPRPQRRVHAARPRHDPCQRRGRCREQLYALLPGPAWPNLLRTMPGRSAGNRPGAQMVPRKSLCREFLVADDHRPVVDSFGIQAGAPARTAARHPRVVFA